MKYDDILRRIKEDTGIEFKLYHSMEERKDAEEFPFEIVVCEEDIEHLTILKRVRDLQVYFDNFLNIKSLTLFWANSEFDTNLLKFFRHLTTLDINYNRLTELPECIKELKNLLVLDISYNRLTALPTCIGELKNLTTLDIRFNSLTDLPSFIGELRNLTTLDIGGNNLAQLPEWIGELKNLTSLNISGNKLTDLPSSIGELNNLTTLDISKNNLTELPEWIGGLKDLKTLDISENSLTELPEWIGGLKDLKTLDISENSLTELPEWIGELKNLKTLDMRRSGLTELPVFIGELKNLTKLNIGANSLTKLSSSIGELKSLITLDISGNSLTELPSSIGELKNLETLNIWGNSLIELPSSLGELKNLETLNIWGNNLTELPDCLGELKNLIKIDISYNGLTELPRYLRELKNIRALDIGGNKLTELPSYLGELKSIKRVDISYTGLTELPRWIVKLKNLTTLIIRGNSLTELPRWIGKLKNLTTLDISNSSLTELPVFLKKLINLKILDISNLQLSHIPKEVIDLGLPFNNGYAPLSIRMMDTKLKKMDISLFEQPYSVIKQFYETDLVELKECKLILLGDGQSGKTCLVERLIEGTYPNVSPPTDGIIIKNWNMCFSNGDNVKIKVLDFGGQEIMHSMHSCFLTSRAVYLVVLDGRQDMLNDLLARNWLENIKTFAPNCPVIIVISKVDDDGNPNASLNGNDLKHDYKDLIFVEKVSAKKDTNIERLKKCIESAIEYSSGYKYYFNANWMKIKEEIEGMEDDYIKDTTYDKICKKYNLHDSYYKNSLLEWFKDLGISYYYKSEEFSPANEKYRVLNPAWLTNGIYTLILKTPSNTGLLTHKIIREALYNNTINGMPVEYTDEEIDFILYVMRQHEISLKVENNMEFIPSKLDKEKPEVDFDIKTSLHLSWSAKYIPNIILHRLMVRNYNKIITDFMWRTGAVFSDDPTVFDSMYQVLIEKNDTQLDLYVHSSYEEPRIYLQDFRESINKALDGIEDVEECIHYIIHGKHGKEFYKDVLTQYLQEPGRKIYLRDIRDYYLPHEILKQTFTEDYIKKQERGENMNNDFKGANIGNLYIVENGDIHLQYAETIKSTDSISDEKLFKLIEVLKDMAQNDRMEKAVRDELKETINAIEGSNKTTWWKRIQDFLGKSANIATLISFGFQITDFISKTKLPVS